MTKLSLFKKGIWKTYLMSFIIVFLVSSVIIISFFYLLISELFQKEFSQSSLNMANQIRDVMDIRIEELYNLTFQMSMEKSIQNLLYAPAPLSPNSLIMVPDTMKALHGYSSANNFISYLCVYYNNSNSVITLEGKYEADYFFKNVINYEEFTEKEIVELLKESHNREFTPLRKIKGNNKVNGNYITYIQSLPVGERNPIASIMMFIDEKTLLSMLGEAMKVEEGQLAIYSPKNDTLISHRPDLLRKNKIVEQVKLGEQTFSINDFNNLKSIGAYSTSNKTDWKYIVTLNYKLLHRKIENIRDLTVFIALISCIIGILMSIMMTKYNYRPWEVLLQYMDILRSKEKDMSASEDNEYSYVKNTLIDILNEREKMRSKIENNRRYVGNQILQNLCEGKKISEEILKSNNIIFPFESFKVITLRSSEPLDYAQVTEGLLEKLNKCYMENNIRFESFIDKEILCIIINYPREIIIENSFEALISNIKPYVKEHIKGCVNIGIGNSYNGIEYLSNSYQESRKSLEYSFLRDSDDWVINYKEVQNSNSLIPELTIDLQMKLLFYTRSANYGLCSKLLDDFFSSLTSQKNISIVDVHYIYYNLINVILQVCEELHFPISDIFNRSREEILDVRRYNNISELIENIYNMYSVLCRHVEENNISEGLRKKIEHFINDNFADKNLSLNEVAEKLDISPSYLSRYIKKISDIGFGDYLNKIRIEKSKVLLVESDKNINEIADIVGYTSTNSFIRSFKRVEGLTPGKYKEYLCKEY